MNNQHRIEDLDLEFKHIIPMNNFKSNLFFLKQITILILGVLNTKFSLYKRNQKKVLEAYEKTYSNRSFQLKDWEDYDNLFDFMFPKSSLEMLQTKNFMVLDNKLCKVSSEEYLKYRPIPLLKILKEFTDSEETIIELGSGWGRNLFYLTALNFKNKLEGYEFTKNGSKFAKEINEFFNCNIKFGHVDLTNDLEIDVSGKTVFTQKVLEQLKYDTEKVINNLIKSKPKQVIHIEPTYELYSNNIRDIASKLYIKTADYQDNLLTTLKLFEEEGKLKILDIRRLKFAAKPIHEDSLIRWIPTSD